MRVFQYTQSDRGEKRSIRYWPQYNNLIEGTGTRKSIYDHTWFVPCNEIIRKNSHVGTVFHYENNHTYEISGPSISLQVVSAVFLDTFINHKFTT